MGRLAIWFAALLLALTVPVAASAASYTFIPNPSGDLWDLDHYKGYTWGVNWTHQDEVITDVSIKIKNIYDWTYEAGDSLYITLLDDPQIGVKTYNDNQAAGNLFGGSGLWLTTWSDPFGDSQHRTTLNYSLSGLGRLNDFLNFAADGSFGFGFDPDCHYYNSGIEVTVNTEVVPEPATITLLGVGLAGGGLLRRFRKNKK